MNILKGLARRNDEIKALSIIAELEEIYADKKNYTQDSLDIIFKKVEKLYQKYSNIFNDAFNSNKQQEVADNYILFAHSSLLSSLVLSKKGAYEIERQVIDFFFTNQPDYITIPEYIKNAFNNVNSENSLRLFLVKSDTEPFSQISHYLDIVQDHVYQQVDMAKGEKLGEIALLHFVQNNHQRAKEFLELQYSKFNKDIDKTIVIEIDNNEALFLRSNNAKEYKNFVESFVKEKKLLKPKV